MLLKENEPINDNDKNFDKCACKFVLEIMYSNILQLT